MLKKTIPPQTQSSSSQDQIRTADRIYVGVVASHQLASHYLCDLVESNDNMMPVILTDETKIGFGLSSRGNTVVLIDLWGLPLPSSKYLQHFSAAIPGCSFLALDRARNGIEVANFLRTGFSGFLRHDDALRLLVPAIIAIAEGRIWASPEVIRIYMNLTSKRTMADGVGIETLTVREHQIMELLRRRYSNKEMASLLNISESTVKFHVSNVLMKSKVNRRRDLMETESAPRLPVCIKPPHKIGATAIKVAPIANGHRRKLQSLNG